MRVRKLSEWTLSVPVVLAVAMAHAGDGLLYERPGDFTPRRPRYSVEPQPGTATRDSHPFITDSAWGARDGLLGGEAL